MKRLLLIAMTVLASPALAGADLQLDYGQRAVDFHRFTDERGATTEWGTDIGVHARFRKDKAPWAFGVYFSQQTFDLDPGHTYFDTVRVTEYGLDGVITLGDKGLSPEISCAYTAAGSITAKTTEPGLLKKSDGSTFATSGESTWIYDMSGAHIRPGVRKEIAKGVSAVLGVDLSFQNANLRSASIRTLPETGNVQAHAKRSTAFDSYAIILGAVAGL